MKLLPWPLKNAGVSAMEQSASKIYLEQRQNEILDLLEKQGSVRVTNLSAHFGISGATIRKDIRALEEQGKLRRTHGGAISIERSEISREEAEMTSHPQKTAIAKRAAQLVVDGDIFLVQSGSTCLEFVRALKGKRNITLITCDLKAALLAEEVLENGTVIILGGPLRRAITIARAQNLSSNCEITDFPKRLSAPTLSALASGLPPIKLHRLNGCEPSPSRQSRPSCSWTQAKSVATASPTRITSPISTA